MTKIIVQLNPDAPPTGSDLGIVNAARKSFGRRSDWDYKLSHWIDGPKAASLEAQGYTFYDESTSGDVFYRLKDKDRQLLEFLARGISSKDFDSFLEALDLHACDIDQTKELLWQWRNTPMHDTPINHGFFSFEVKAPIFVRAQLVKHEYLIMSEYSRRYITDDVEFYEHTYREVAEDKKQGSGGTHQHTEDWQRKVYLKNMKQVELYNAMLKDGVAPEQARGVLPQDLMTSWTWSGTFGAFAKMCQLRLANDTQKETRYVAECVYKHLEEQFPVAAPMFVKGVF